MMIVANKLPVGAVVISGEVVQGILPAKYQKNPKVLVKLFNPKTGKTRLGTWNYYSDIFVKEIQGS
jgi:hypothetical protein